MISCNKKGRRTVLCKPFFSLMSVKWDIAELFVDMFLFSLGFTGKFNAELAETDDVNR